MPARKTVAKSAKGKKPAAAKSAAKKPVPAARKPASKAKAAAPARRPAPPKSKTAARPVAKAAAKVQDKKPAVTQATKTKTPAKQKTTKPPAAKTATAGSKAAPAARKPSTAGSDAGLLAGPRNVQPYVAKSGEQYMNRGQLDHFRQILSSWKQDLMEEVDRTVSHMKDEAANFPDPNDRATQEEEFSLELRTRDRERKLIRKIEEALERIEDGSYGYCLETGEPIGVKRLEARPVATLSLEAQERRERRERQYGDRDDRYR
ncbi:MAG: hypothetical protein RLZZ393_1370 [Pseudomonadota bacterium]|jgi:DnaK suppressor protein